MTATSLIPTISKRRRTALDNTQDWTPEQALEAALYDLRNGDIDPDSLIVVYAVRNENGAHEVGHYLATGAEQPSSLFTAGMLHKAIADLTGDA